MSTMPPTSSYSSMNFQSAFNSFHPMNTVAPHPFGRPIPLPVPGPIDIKPFDPHCGSIITAECVIRTNGEETYAVVAPPELPTWNDFPSNPSASGSTVTPPIVTVNSQELYERKPLQQAARSAPSTSKLAPLTNLCCAVCSASMATRALLLSHSERLHKKTCGFCGKRVWCLFGSSLYDSLNL